MKNNNFICILALMIFIVSCNDDFTNVTPTDGAPESAIWNDPGLATAAVTNVYENLSTGGFGAEMLASLTDEAVYTHTGARINTTTEGRANSNDNGFIADENQWAYIYVGVRNANLAIKGLQEGDIGDDALKDRLLGEATFLRAFYYHKLVRFYGGVPIIDDVFGLDSEFTNPRNTYEECIEFIVNDCDTAFGLLDGKSMDGGRATAEAALALKARMLMDAASDLHDASKAAANSSLLGGFANYDILGYPSGDQQARWVRAKSAAQAVLDYASGYKTGLSAPESLDAAKENYINASLAQNGGEEDILWERQFNTEGDEWGGKRIGLFNGPNGYHNWAGNTPIQNLIDAYAMEDGSDFDWDNPAHASAPYENREPRFYASILYDGADWKPRTDDVASRDPANQVQTGSYEINSGTWAGLDTRQGPVEDWNGTRTGYYVRKFINNDPSIVDFQQFQTIPWPFFRYTEAMLNFVEACIETGDEANAIAWLNRVRYRAGLPAVTATGADLVTAYRKERRVELAYEESRYHDIRRWMVTNETHGAPVKIINVSGALKAGASVDSYAYDKNNYDYTYTVQDIDPGFENRVWLDKMYYLPLHISQIQADPSLVQNPGYE